MAANFILSSSESALADRFPDHFIAHIDGSKARTLRQFYDQIADALEFPDFGNNLDALNDALNDLQWLEDEKIVLYFTNTDQLISQERDPKKMASVLAILEATAEDWKWMADDETDLADKKEFSVVFETSPRLQALMEQEGIAFETVG
ncbi:barstar family protein [Fibrivirga algicola]|uniref:Barstar family protein n=1 Tax=Fibrivirga algicola TaxID=2950420 RepID=A0ABX0QIT2_9BACT|nr:barstar family protein [Fibrivirga algicola]NID11738.1 barstar family protein [Fibrivirga algicola]